MKIKILLASPRGYCAGVNRAIEILNKVLKLYPSPIYVNHEIIHNKFIINFYKKKWIIFWENLDKMPEKSLIIFSAHWVWPKFIERVKKRKLKYIDASCPLVTKVHLEAKNFLKNWYEIIYIWKEGHQEAEWVKEENLEKIHIIWSENDLEKININQNSKLALLTQTTLSTLETKKLIEKIKNKFPKIVLPKASDICYATTNRQKTVREICEKNIDLLIIVGSKNSSNSNKLKNIWEEFWVKSLLIDSYKEIDFSVLEKIYKNKSWLSTEGFNPLILKIWISSGASAPDILVKELLEFFKNKWKVLVKNFQNIEEKMFFSSDFNVEE